MRRRSSAENGTAVPRDPQPTLKRRPMSNAARRISVELDLERGALGLGAAGDVRVQLPATGHVEQQALDPKGPIAGRAHLGLEIGPMVVLGHARADPERRV